MYLDVGNLALNMVSIKTGNFSIAVICQDRFRCHAIKLFCICVH